MSRFLRYLSTSVLHTPTGVPKDVILFKYENPKHYKYLNWFGMSQYAFWMYLGHFSYTCLKDAPVTSADENTVWWRKLNLGENKYRNGITICCLFVGCTMLCGSWIYTLRSVRYLVLRKGGKSVSFVTYTPFGKNRIIDVPLDKISAAESRTNAKVQLPIKIYGKYFYYMLDMRGEFLNKSLFDATAGLKRTLR